MEEDRRGGRGRKGSGKKYNSIKTVKKQTRESRGSQPWVLWGSHSRHLPVPWFLLCEMAIWCHHAHTYMGGVKNMLLCWRVISWKILRWHRKGLVFQSRLRQQASRELSHRAKSSNPGAPCSPSRIFFSCMSWAHNCDSCTWILEKACSLSGQNVGPTCRALLCASYQTFIQAGPLRKPRSTNVYAELTTESCWIFRSLIVHVPAFIWAIFNDFQCNSHCFP